MRKSDPETLVGNAGSRCRTQSDLSPPARVSPTRLRVRSTDDHIVSLRLQPSLRLEIPFAASAAAVEVRMGKVEADNRIHN